jgi:phosphoribosylformylglycinamidine synthase subunit PurS
MKAKVHVTLKTGVLDPQGKAIQQALHGLGFDEVGEVRQGKFIEVELPEASNANEAQEAVKAMCEKLLANPVIEDYRIDIAE